MLTKSMGFRDFLRLPNKMSLFLLILEAIPLVIGSKLRGEKAEYTITWAGGEVNDNEKKKRKH